MSCFWFGHRLPTPQQKLKEEMEEHAFICPRCGKAVFWIDMPKAVRRMRDEYLRRITKHPQQQL